MTIISLAAVLFLLIPVLTIIALVDLLRRPESQWRQSGQSQLVWAIAVIFLTLVGAILYFTIARPRLEDAATTPDGT